MTLTVSISHHLYLPCRLQYTIRIIYKFSCIFLCICTHTCMVYAFVCTRCIDVGASVSARVFVCGVVYKNKNKYKYEMSLWHTSAKRISFDPRMHSSTHKQEISISHLSTFSHTYTDTRTCAALAINLHNNKFLNRSPYHIIYIYIHIYLYLCIDVCHSENNIIWREKRVSTERTYSCTACT
jgi:hypothetical protein